MHIAFTKLGLMEIYKQIDGYTIFHYGLKEQVCSRGQNGVAIILSPTFSKYNKLSGLLPPTISEDNDLALGRFISIKLNIEVKVKEKNKGAFGKKKTISKTIKLFISSEYHPVDDKDQIEFNNFIFYNM